MSPGRNVISLAHGGGGIETSELIERLIVPMFSKISRVGNVLGLDLLDDSAAIPLGDGRYLLFTIDSYTVSPIFFPGGDIGSLSIIGSINDVAVMGGEPAFITCSIVLEEGLPLSTLRRILDSMRKVLEGENVALVGGDLKVMGRGQVDKIVVTTSCIGFTSKDRLLTVRRIREGDKLIVTGPIGEHGATILALQSGIDPDRLPFKSDLAPLTRAVNAALSAGEVHKARDLTRGGLAMALNDLAKSNGLAVVVDEGHIPVKREVREFSDMLGVDVYSLACEGTALLAVAPEDAENVIERLVDVGYNDASIIGEVRSGRPGVVVLKTRAGGYRILEPPSGEIVPRIC